MAPALGPTITSQFFPLLQFALDPKPHPAKQQISGGF